MTTPFDQEPNPMTNSPRVIAAWRARKAEWEKIEAKRGNDSVTRDQAGQRSGDRFGGAAYSSESTRQTDFELTTLRLQAAYEAQAKVEQAAEQAKNAGEYQRQRFAPMSEQEQKRAFQEFHEAKGNRSDAMARAAHTFGFLEKNSGFHNRAEIERTNARLFDPYFVARFDFEDGRIARSLSAQPTS